MIDEKTIMCQICGEPYKFYMFSAADQSACPSCVRKANKNSKSYGWENFNNNKGEMNNE